MAVLGTIAAWWSIGVAASFWVQDSGSAQGSLGMAIVFVLLPVSIVSVLLVAVWLKRRSRRRSGRGRSRGGCGQAAQMTVPLGCH